MGANILMVFLGGGLGSVCRFFLGHLNQGNQLPVGTISANVLACLLLGYLAARFQNSAPENAILMLLFATGFCGGFSTFSTYMLESVMLSKGDMVWTAMLNIIISIILGLFAIIGGMKIFTLINA